MRNYLLLMVLALGAWGPVRAQVAASPVAPVELALYPGTIPDSKPGEAMPTLLAFLPPPGRATGTSVIICPGGGYGIVAFAWEGTPVAMRLAALGVTTFVLKYRLPTDRSQPDKSIAPLLDAQQALRLVRQRATTYGLNPERIGLMGFSAGGHLAATAATHYARPVGEHPGPESVRPAFSVLIYPVISLADSLMHKGSRDNLLGPSPSAAQVREFSNELHVTAQTPPTFLVHCQDDRTVPVQNSLVYYQALLRHQVPAELHLFPKGGHGFALYNKTTQDQWFDRLHEWLVGGGWLPKS